MMAVATTSFEVWNALKGILCIHKPSGLRLSHLLNDVNDKIISELNKNNPETNQRYEIIENIQKEGGLIDYSSHPNVLGDGYDTHDIELDAINDLSEFSSGLSVISINAPDLAKNIREDIPLRQYLLQAEVGKATDNSLCFGKVLQKSTWSHLKGRPQLLEKLLANIRSSHQRDAFRQAGVNLRSSEAYQLALKGLVKPTKEHPGATLIYGLECVTYQLPYFHLRVTCVNESPIYLAELVAEIGLKLRTTAVLNGINLVKYGAFSSANALLIKDINLQNVINNIHRNHQALELADAAVVS